MNSMITRHQSLATCQTNHRLMRQKDIFHHLLLISITATTISQIVFRASSHSLLEVALLKTLDKSSTHNGRKIAILTV
ncbi:Uncharacterised protein [Segatella copri]|nr:Uncharacterised protein [Segatella copri]